jgi:hypothetical protein
MKTTKDLPSGAFRNLLFLVTVATFAFAGTVKAEPYIIGSFNYSDNYQGTPDNSLLSISSNVGSFTLNNPAIITQTPSSGLNAGASSPNGAFAGLGLESLTFNVTSSSALTLTPSGGIAVSPGNSIVTGSPLFMTIGNSGTFTFDLQTIYMTAAGNSISVLGTGTVSGSGYTTSQASFTLTQSGGPDSGYDGTFTATTVPEPPVWALMLFGALLLVHCSRRQSTTAKTWHVSCCAEHNNTID